MVLAVGRSKLGLQKQRLPLDAFLREGLQRSADQRFLVMNQLIGRIDGGKTGLHRQLDQRAVASFFQAVPYMNDGTET